METINAISLFTGSGQLDIGFDAALRHFGYNVRTILYCEANKNAVEVIKARIRDGLLPDAPIWPDVRTLPATRLRGIVGAVVGGFPCQDLSVAGKQAGFGTTVAGGASSAMKIATLLAADSFSRCGGLPSTAGLPLSALRTYPVSEVQNALFQTEVSDQPPLLSLKPWPKSGICIDGYIWPLKTSARLTVANDGGVSRPWLTPKVMDALPAREEEALRRQHENNRPGRTTLSTLREQVVYGDAPWSTPSVSRGDYTRDGGDPEKERLRLPGQVANWSTPQQDDANNGTRESGAFKSLTRDVHAWPSPQARDVKGESGAGRQERRGNPADNLPNAMKQWPSPQAKDFKSGQVSDEVFDRNSRPLNEHIERNTVGEQLNPEWEELLMGWPLGWTDATKPCAGVWPGFPMGQGGKQFNFEPPRTIPKGSMNGRTKRVEMCGNGVVPQQAEAGYYELLAEALA